MSGLIEYCIELNQTSELAAPQETVSGPPSAASSLPSSAQRPQLQRQGSVVCSRLQHLSTIDYVEEGEHAHAYTTCTRTHDTRVHMHICAPRGAPGSPGNSEVGSSCQGPKREKE